MTAGPRPGTNEARVEALAPLGLAADRRDRDVAHRRVGLGAVPVALAGLDVHDVADIDLVLLVLVGHHARARRHDQDLVAGVGVPAGRAALAEIHDAAVVVLGLARLDDGLPRPLHGTGPPLDAFGALDRHIRDVFQRNDLHGVSPSLARQNRSPGGGR